MIRTIEEAIIANSERAYDNRQNLRRKDLQRRNQVTDLYGDVFHAQGDATNPARFYISVSPDLIYYERFQFKLEIQPFTASVKGATTNTAVTIEKTSLSGTDGSISPNPHGHTSPAHGHTIVNGVSKTNVNADTFRFIVDGIDITPYLMEQHGGDWIEGEGLYPTTGLDEDVENFYDLLDVATLLVAEGKEEQKTKLLAPGFKKVEIDGNGFFGVDLFLYLKYPHLNR